MKEIHDYQKDITSIRSVMERSVKFVSLSGLSGILAGIYALIGSALVYYHIYYPYSPFGFRFYFIDENSILIKLLIIASVVLILSLGTAYFLSAQKAKRLGVQVWNNVSRQLLINLLIPLITGGILILIFIARANYEIVAPFCLIFYGLALMQASPYTIKEIQYLGFFEILLGIICAWLPGYGLLFWAAGFGLLHIVYGFVMHYRYDR